MSLWIFFLSLFLKISFIEPYHQIYDDAGCFIFLTVVLIKTKIGTASQSNAGPLNILLDSIISKKRAEEVYNSNNKRIYLTNLMMIDRIIQEALILHTIAHHKTFLRLQFSIQIIHTW